MPYEIYKDTGFVTGTHEGGVALYALKSSRVDFEVIEAKGRLIENVTDGSSGTVAFHYPLDHNLGYSFLLVALSGGTTNRWNPGDRFKLYIGTSADAEISRTVISKESGFAYPRKELINGEHPSEMDEDPETME